MAEYRPNCWEHNKCGRVASGRDMLDRGVCAAAKDSRHTGVNGGAYGGRICWVVAGSLGVVLLDCACPQQVVGCMACDFFRLVKAQEGEGFVLKP